MSNLRKKKDEWEFVAYETHRLKVPGGWIYKVGYQNQYPVYVPDPDYVSSKENVSNQQTWPFDVNIGDITEDGCEILGKTDRGYLVSSRLEDEEIEAALARGAKRVIV